MAESEETGLEQVSFEESDDDSSFEVIEDPNNPQVSIARNYRPPIKPFSSKSQPFWLGQTVWADSLGK